MRVDAIVAALVLLLGNRAPAQQQAPAPDPIDAATAMLQRAVLNNDLQAFRALTAPQLPELEGLGFEVSLLGGGITAATFRERDRELIGGGARVLIEVLAERGNAGQITTWQIAWLPTASGLRIARLRRTSAVNGLFRLQLDTSTAYAVKDFTYTATDFRLTMTTGVAFVAKSRDGITAIVLRGEGRARFAPPDSLERHQLVRFAKSEALDEPIEAAYIRLNPDDYSELVGGGQLTPILTLNRDVNRARDIFNRWSERSYNVGLGDLSPERWSMLPSSNNSYWYPQNVVTDYATARIRASVPTEYEAVCSGTRIDEGTVGREHVTSFSTDMPARYLTTIIARLEPIPPTTLRLPSGKTMTIDARSTPRHLGDTKTLTARAGAIMAFYGSLVGDVPYPSFTLLSLEADLPGGHSPAYMAAVNQPTPNTVFGWRNDPIAFDNVFPNFYLAHEIAHQWWGQAIGVKSYHDQWLSEGLAQYFAWLYAGADRGPAVQAQILERMRQSVRKYGDSGPIWLGYRLGHVVGDGSNYRAIVYNKSVLALEALRAELGDTVFNAGLRRFYQDWKFRKAGTDDLRRAFEAEAGRPLGPFFEAWILGAGTL